MTGNHERLLDVYLQEYYKLKGEQVQRIGFRDNLLYTTLIIFGTVLTFSYGDARNPYALLVLPWVSLILGWTYLMNDQKITAIGRYLRYTLSVNIAKATAAEDIETILGWETAHRSDNERKRRKFTQLMIDELTFVASGFTALIAFWCQATPLLWSIVVLSTIELILLIFLGVEIFIYADLAKGR
jgi:hypothetical protein